MGKKQKKAGAGKEKTLRKTAKSEEKQRKREDKKLKEEDDIDAILAKIQKEDSKKVAVHIDENVPAPSPRCNASVTINPTKDNELIIYGGEYYNGVKTFVYGDLYRYNAEKAEWKHVSSPNSPPPRSAHQAVAWKNNLFIFGGEFTSPNQEKFHHYKDLWKFDLTTNTWEQLNLKGAPSPRSGHRMIMYKHKIILFGGFYDTLREVRYFNDLYVLDLDDYKWQEVKPTPGQLWPSARSAFQFAATGDEIFMYGGYFKDHTSVDKEVSEKGVVLADMWSLDPRTFEWNKVKKIGLPPGPRAGFSMCVHKKRVVFFGGVVDSEDTGDLMRSIFLNEMYGFQMDNRRWYPMELRKAKVAKPKTRGRGGKSSGPSLSDQPGSDTLAKVEETAEVADMDIDEKAELAEQMKGTLLQENDSVEDEIVRPCGRINASMVVGKDTLYLYGGMMEIGDREITLDDLYTLDLNKLDSWKCLIEATEADWVEEEDDDDDEDDEDDDEDDEEDDDDEDDDDEMAETDKAESSAAPSAAEAAAAVLRGGGKKLSRKQRKAEIDRIRAELGLADAQRTPLAGETLRDFFNRTLMYWQEAAYAHTQHTGKELRKDGFDLAESRYKELKPVLDELEKLEKDQKAEEEEDASRLLSMKKSKEKAKAGSRR
ncbi:hypothetical protein MPTK1_1g22040 [Marchantia polymorpha subsp. ruderalis]|uniref:DUF4110 domain-containing protein n=2 Tax=Marchantia polymorpha TaxID=3197 RepID=A0AAF6ASZ0_MARPO|nr:hypothetical protein MARPO_0001s0540 [Marchantia polymorpha]BBM99560.1 hypothetical protein Mp_1g22040 [Marchantia polymorpha subsp. ruderalis]|eukprot:PTQ50646.1 hypothetical protein MARPO_0001s0540 [Marchantia polymorpha]